MHRGIGKHTRTHTHVRTHTLNSTQRHIKEVGDLQHSSPTSLQRRDSHHHRVSSCSWRAKPPPATLPFTISSLLTRWGFLFLPNGMARRFWKHNADGRLKWLFTARSVILGWTVDKAICCLILCVRDERGQFPGRQMSQFRQRQSHSIEIKPRWKSWSWETSPERLSDAGNYSSANTPADLQLLYHLIRALCGWGVMRLGPGGGSARGRMWWNESSCLTSEYASCASVACERRTQPRQRASAAS